MAFGARRRRQRHATARVDGGQEVENHPRPASPLAARAPYQRSVTVAGSDASQCRRGPPIAGGGRTPGKNPDPLAPGAKRGWAKEPGAARAGGSPTPISTPKGTSGSRHNQAVAAGRRCGLPTPAIRTRRCGAALGFQRKVATASHGPGLCSARNGAMCRGFCLRSSDVSQNQAHLPVRSAHAAPRSGMPSRRTVV